jgi:hypothetical protein
LGKARNADAIEVSADRVIVRLRGCMDLAGSSGGALFGVQVPRKDQLHTFDKL